MSEPVVVEIDVECSECGASLYASFESTNLRGLLSVSPCSRCVQIAIEEDGRKDGGDV